MGGKLVCDRLKISRPRLEQKIDELIVSDKELSEKYRLVTSVPGIGKITFYYLVYFTNEFQNYSQAKQLACYLRGCSI